MSRTIFSKISLPFAALALLLYSCRNAPAPPAAPPAPPVPDASAAPHVLRPPSDYGALFEAVQMNRVFPDSKTFADCTPRVPVGELLQRYEAAKDQPGFDLAKFVADNFDPPVPHSTNFRSDPSHTVEQHINALWPVLTRAADTTTRPGTLLPLPNPYVVPGGRFGEIYYWDSYFTMLGLEAAGRRDLIENMVANFAYLIDTYGHIPNGNRSYYLGRSQPPFFSLMVALLDGQSPLAGPSATVPASGALVRYLPQLEKEYAFWMDGIERARAQPAITPDGRAYRRIVALPDGAAVNRYFDDEPAPRPEAYREDVETARAVPDRAAEAVYRDLRAAAESGIDFSSRWGVGKDLTGIRTTAYAPVDLNSLLWHLEASLAAANRAAGRTGRADSLAQLAERRAETIRKLHFDPASGYFYDYDFMKGKLADVVTVAGMYPLFFGLATNEQATAAVRVFEKNLVKAGGVVTTPNHTGQQWDAPNGWAPLQWMSIGGLRRYGQTALANSIKQRWVKLNTDVYKRTGKLLEKYNVEDLSLEAGGGEYPVQDGFGWTNGVLLRLMTEKQ